MNNEILLFFNLIFVYALLLFCYHFFKKEGVFCFLVLASVLANIEVAVQIDAFGLHQTLGNTLFAATFLATDILSEFYDKKTANKAVHLSIIGCLMLIVVSKFWLFFEPNVSDFVLPHLQIIAERSDRIVLSGLLVFILVQKLDIFLYHKIWNLTGNFSHRFLWLRNNAATIISQGVNALLFNFLAFYGVFPFENLLEIIVSTFIIFVVTSLADTPFIYFAKRL